MKLPALPRLPASAGRLALAAVPAFVLLVGAWWLVRPGLVASWRAAAECRQLEGRITLLQRAAARPVPAGVSSAATLQQFNRLVPADDRTPELMETIARLALEPEDERRARNLSVQAGDPPAESTTAAPQPAAEGTKAAVTLDPRWALFPGTLTYTPVTVTFECTYERLGSFLWSLRDLPTLVEVRSLDVTRALPLLKVKLVLFALRRSDRSAPRPQAPTMNASPLQPVPRVGHNLAPDANGALPWLEPRARGTEVRPWP